jgi:NAD+ kinase
MIIALFPNTLKSNSKKLTSDICEYLTHRGVTVVLEDSDAQEIGAKPLSQVDPKEIDFTISLGGDGTILRLLHRHPELEAPLLGINLGGLGFMADIPSHDIFPSLENLLNGHYQLSNRIVMEGQALDKESCFAVNEIVIHRAQNPCLVDLAIHVDGIYLNTFSADGVIFSTPSGSTAYSLAAGGPILTPELEAFVITPISPHTISNRPLVLMPSHEIQVQYISEHEPVEVTYDGFPRLSMACGEIFKIKCSTKRFILVSMPYHDYFSTLRSKLGWAGKLKA